MWWGVYKFLKMLYNGPYFYFVPMFTWLIAFEGIVLHETGLTPPVTQGPLM
jgi:hypothetical protein